MRKIIIILCIIFFTACSKSENNITISVSSSLVPVMTEIANLYNENININSASGNALYNQIKNGAEVGLFFSADASLIDSLISENIIDEKINITKNSLVLVCNKDAIDSTSIAIADEKSSPLGKYTNESMEKIQEIYNFENYDFIYAQDALTCKNYVEIGNANLGIIYKTDALDLESSEIIYNIPSDSHSEIIYAAGLVSNYKYKQKCKDFLDFVIENKNIFTKYGFEE